jgi:hypothetical protein
MPEARDGIDETLEFPAFDHQDIDVGEGSHRCR